MAEALAHRKSRVGALWRWVLGFFTQVIGNPVVGREIRVRARFGRNYLLQAVYLLFLILIVLPTYDSVVRENLLRNPFEAQRSLQSFYWVVTSTLITLIALVAPALTANAITLERERRTLDLLVATPLTARELLTGKLVGSMALVLLLLALTLPISAISLLLGGTTLAEMVETYAMVALSAMVLSAFALFTSAYAKNSTLAVFWSYLRIGAVLFVLFVATAGQAERRGGGMGGFMGDELVAPIGLLSPFTAPFAAGTVLRIFGWAIPAWVVSLLLCLLATRLLLTGAAFKVGLYDRDLLPSVRRQLAVGFFLISFCFAFSIAFLVSELVSALFYTAGFLLVLMVLVIVFVAPYGHQDDRLCPNDGIFRPWRMFRSNPSGALPYILLLWVASVAGGMLVLWEWKGRIAMQPIDWWTLAFLLGYLTCLWVFLWGIGRFCSAMLRGRNLVGARALTFVAITAVLVVPILLALILFPESARFEEAYVLYLSPIYPLLYLPESAIDPFGFLDVCMWYSIALLALGLSLGLLQPSQRKRDVS